MKKFDFHYTAINERNWSTVAEGDELLEVRRQVRDYLNGHPDVRNEVKIYRTSRTTGKITKFER